MYSGCDLSLRLGRGAFIYLNGDWLACRGKGYVNPGGEDDGREGKRSVNGVSIENRAVGDGDRGKLIERGVEIAGRQR